MERAVEVFAVIQLTIIGLSHIVFHRAWAGFFIWLREKGLAGAFANGFTSLAFGSIVVAFHRVWSGIPLVLTVFGILNLVKAAQVLPAACDRAPLDAACLDRTIARVRRGRSPIARDRGDHRVRSDGDRMTITPLQRGLEIFAVIHLGLMGLSHVFQPRAWVEFFIALRTRGYAGVFINGFLSLSFGAAIVAMHRVWSGLPMVLSILGVLCVVKAFHSFLIPAISMRSLNRVSLERSREFVGAGVALLALAAVVTVALVRGG